LDVGGTSADIVVVRDGRLKEAPWEERRVGGYPLQIPMLDLHTIGAGGGSLAYRDRFGALHVGPESAGAMPGPACYGLGGTQPTVTDAAVVCGRLPAHVLLGGAMPIKASLARESLSTNFEVSGDDLVSTALDVLRLAESHIAFGIRERTVARGLDPADLSLVAAGGAGSLLACGVADVLGLAEVVVPPRPGLLAAWGLLVAPQRREATVTVLRPLRELDADDAVSFFRRAEQMLPQAPENIGSRAVAMRRTAALRYLGQGFEVEVDVKDPSDLQDLAARFHDAHELEYGFALRRAPVEWVELRSSWEVAAPDWTFPASAPGGLDERRRTPLWELQKEEGTLRPVEVQALTMSRRALDLGDRLPGPAILLETDATIYIPGGWQAQVVEGGYLRIRHDGR
jgi:N-methylhydantoinase A